MNQLLKKALNEIGQLKSGEKFLVKDLFKGYEWNRLPVKDRLNLGRFFFEESQNPLLESGDIIALDKTSSGQQMYQKR